jgi:glutamate--cysteine ligase
MAHVPHLATPLTEPLHKLEQDILANQVAIESWFRQQWQKTLAPIYSSVDLRNAGFKLAPIDTNLFSAGFNNLNSELLPLCIQAMQNTLAQQFPDVQKILFIPENHTRNTFYLENVATMLDILERAGYDVKLGSVADDLTLPLTLSTASGRSITLYPVHQQNNQLICEAFVPELVFLNNDLSGGLPSVLTNVNQPMIPNPRLGWDYRLKSQHFTEYNDVAEEFAALIDIDPWLINPLFRNCGEVDFMQGTGIECLQHNAEVLFAAIEKKYQDYGITEQPYVIVKADAGSYGMGVMSIKSADELAALNRKQRTHMAKTKGKVAVSKVILQEGVYTFEKWDNHVAEPVVYMIGDSVVGGFYRVNTERGDDENLNSPGMRFESLAFVNTCQAPGKSLAEASQRRFYVYGVIARLAALASAREIDNLQVK